MTPYSTSTIRHLASALFFNHDPDARYFAVMSEYTVYLDASGDNDDAMIAIGGFIATVRQWEAFEDEWKKILDDAEVTHFHRKNFIAKRPPFDGHKWLDEENICKPFMTALTQAIVRNVKFQILNVLRVTEWRIANQQYCLQESKWSPYALSSMTAMDAAYVWAEQNGIPSHHLEFFFESGDNGQEDLRFHSRRRWGFEPGFKPKEPNNQFPNAKELTPLQAADFVAGYSRAAELGITAPGTNMDDYKVRKCLEVLLDNVPGHETSEMFNLAGILNFCRRENIKRRSVS